jgi:hypothetical protein
VFKTTEASAGRCQLTSQIYQKNNNVCAGNVGSTSLADRLLNHACDRYFTVSTNEITVESLDLTASAGNQTAEVAIDAKIKEEL